MSSNPEGTERATRERGGLLDIVADRTRLVAIGATAVIIACVVFGAVRLMVELDTGKATPWWGNAAGAAAMGLLFLWFRAAPEQRSVVSVHGTCFIATVALVIPAAYEMSSSKWWLALVGFSAILMGRRSEALIWGTVTAVLIPTVAVLEGSLRVPNALGETPLEAALAGLFFVLILFGITAAFRRAAEERARKLDEAARSLARSNEVRSRFLAHMSHDIRTPLHGVIAMTDLALEGQASEEVREQVLTANESAQVLLTLLNNILDVTRADADAIELVERPFSLHDALGETLRPLGARARAKGIVLTATSEPDVRARRIGDRARFVQIVLNLVGNALKFTKEGTIQVGLRAIGADRIELTVRDTGIGIADDKVGDIFSPFMQAATADARVEQGAGLGLAITRYLAQRMNGEVRVESRLGAGSAFTVELRLPVDPSDSSPGPTVLVEDVRVAPSRPSWGPIPKRRVLVCEDEPTNRRVMRRMLTRFGHEVVMASDGQEAWKLLQEERFDLLFTDVEMPEMDGLELTRRIRDRERITELPRLTVIAATAHVGQDEEHRLLDAGADAHLPKPFTMRALEELLNRFA